MYKYGTIRNMIPTLPKEAKPHECGVLICYSLGHRSPEEIQNKLHYPTKDTIYRVLRKYRDILPSLVVAPQPRFIGRGLIK